MKKEELQILAQQLSHPQGDYGKTLAQTMSETNSGMIRSGFQALRIQQKDYILELGPGNASHVNGLFSLNENIRYIGLEISETMQQEACRINQFLHAEEKADFLWYNGNEIPFGDETFSKIITINTLYFWHDPEVLLAELYRVLIPKGIFVLGYLSKETLDELPFTEFGFRKNNGEEIELQAAKVGFKISNRRTEEEQVKGNVGYDVKRLYHVLTLQK